MTNTSERESSALNLVEQNITRLGILAFEKQRYLQEKISVIEDLDIISATDQNMVRLARTISPMK